MQHIILYYGRIVLFMILAAIVYISLGDLINPGPKVIGFFMAIFYITIFGIFPSLLILVIPNQKRANWTKSSHAAILKLSTREREVLDWNYKKVRRGKKMSQLYPRTSPQEYEELLLKLQRDHP